jgi:hypothetical protein
MGHRELGIGINNYQLSTVNSKVRRYRIVD